jgi:hypothetical protein
MHLFLCRHLFVSASQRVSLFEALCAGILCIAQARSGSELGTNPCFGVAGKLERMAFSYLRIARTRIVVEGQKQERQCRASI